MRVVMVVKRSLPSDVRMDAQASPPSTVRAESNLRACADVESAEAVARGARRGSVFNLVG
jgi:hypothetical protein